MTKNNSDQKYINNKVTKNNSTCYALMNISFYKNIFINNYERD